MLREAIHARSDASMQRKCERRLSRRPIPKYRRHHRPIDLASRLMALYIFSRSKLNDTASGADDAEVSHRGSQLIQPIHDAMPNANHGHVCAGFEIALDIGAKVAEGEMKWE